MGGRVQTGKEMRKVVIFHRTTYGQLYFVHVHMADHRVAWTADPGEAIPIDRSALRQISARSPYHIESHPWTPQIEARLKELASRMTFHHLDITYDHRGRLRTVCGRFVSRTEISINRARVNCKACLKKLEEE